MQDAESPSSPPAPSSPPRGYWRAATYACLLALVVGFTAARSMYEQFVAQVRDLQQRVQQTAQLQYVAVLHDAKGAPAMLLTQLTGDGFLQMQRLNTVVEGGEDSLQLWALSDGAPARSLGVLTPKLTTMRLPATAQTLDGVQALGLSVEARGGVPQSQGPRLPYLFTGTVIRRAL